MNNSRQKKLILLYQLFAIFSLVFQTFAPLLATAAPVFAADASATASADLTTADTFESSAQIKLEIEEADEAEVVEEVLDDESLVAGEAEAVLDDTKAEADAGEEVAEEKVVEEETVEQEDVAVIKIMAEGPSSTPS